MRLIKNKGVISFIIAVIFLSIIIVSFQGYFKISLYPLFRNIEANRILWNTRDYYTLETDHFIVKYQKMDAEIAILTAEIAEKYYNNVCKMFNYYPQNKSNIIIYDNSSDLLDNVRLKQQEPPMGVYYGGIINILSPELWINSSDDFNIVYEKDGPIVHEFTHLIVDDITKGNYPMWLTEGIALYTEYKITGFEWGKDLLIDSEVSLKDLEQNFQDIRKDIAYRKSFEVINDVSENWGFDKVNMMLNILGEGKNMDNSIKAVLKINLYELK